MLTITTPQPSYAWHIAQVRYGIPSSAAIVTYLARICRTYVNHRKQQGGYTSFLSGKASFDRIWIRLSKPFDIPRCFLMWMLLDRAFPALPNSVASALLELLHCASTTRPVQNDGVSK